MCGTVGLLGEPTGYDLQSDQRLDFRDYLADIHACADRPRDPATAKDSKAPWTSR